jgi:hypothetical protein
VRGEKLPTPWSTRTVPSDFPPESTVSKGRQKGWFLQWRNPTTQPVMRPWCDLMRGVFYSVFFLPITYHPRKCWGKKKNRKPQLRNIPENNWSAFSKLSRSSKLRKVCVATGDVTTKHNVVSWTQCPDIWKDQGNLNKVWTLVSNCS